MLFVFRYGARSSKTVITLTDLEQKIYADFDVNRALVIAPKTVAETVWKDECRKWDHLKDLRCVKVLGSAKDRAKALHEDADLYIINRENIMWLIEYLAEQKTPWPFDEVVIDELSSFKSAQSKRWKALKKVIGQSKYVIGLTGTPAGNGYMDLWPEIFLIDGGLRLGKTIGAYRARYFTMGAHKGHIVYEWKPRIGAQAAIDRQLADVCLSMSAKDWLDLPPVLYNEIPVQMDAAGRKLYEKFKVEKVLPLIKSIQGKTVTDNLTEMDSVVKGETAAMLAGKLLQMANGAVYDDTGEVLHIHDAKIEALLELIDASQGQPILLFYAYKHDLARIKAAVPEAEELKDEDTVKRWNEGKIPVLLCHPSSAAYGINLQAGGHIVCWFGLTWSLELYEQANARLPRIGQEHTVVINHIICKDTLDEKVMAALSKKGDAQKALLDALKNYIQEEVA